MARDSKAPGPNSAVSVRVQLPVMLVRAVHAQSQAVATYLEAGDHVGRVLDLHRALGSKRYFFAA